MEILGSKSIFNEIERVEGAMNDFVAAGDMDNARICEGQIKQLNINLKNALEKEDELRHAPAPKVAPKNFAELVLGARDEFRGMKPVDTISIESPIETDFDIPGKEESPFGTVAATLASAPSVGDVKYFQRSTQTGDPDTWAGVGEAKPQVVYSWLAKTALAEVIAAYVPISEESLADYDELAAIITNDLAIDSRAALNKKVVAGNNSNGIIGITNTIGIQSFTTASAYFEAIRKMKTLVMKNANRIPDCVAVSPEVRESLDLYKTSEGLYQALGSDFLWGLRVVEDPTVDGILVYDSTAAKIRTVRGLDVKTGTVNDQFIKNELCIRMEQKAALEVRYPSAFCFAKTADLTA